MHLSRRATLAAAATLAAPTLLPRGAVAQQRPAELRLGISTFLSGPSSVRGPHRCSACPAATPPSS